MCPAERDAFAAAAGGPRLRGRPEADPEGMAACGQSLEGFAQMQCSQPLVLVTLTKALNNPAARLTMAEVLLQPYVALLLNHRLI